MAKPHNRSRPPPCVNEVLHLSPLLSLRGRKKKEDLETTSQMERQDQALLIIVLLYYCTRSHYGGGGGSICLPIRRLLLLNYIVTPDLPLLCDYCQLFLVIKCGCFNDLGESVVQWQDGPLSRELCELVSLQNFEGKQCHQPSHHTQVEYRSEIIEHRPLVTWQSLCQSEAFPPLSLGQPQPIRDFPAIEPGTLQCHNTKVI